MGGKFDDPESFLPEKVEDDPYADLFEGLNAQEVLELQAELDALEE